MDTAMENTEISRNFIEEIIDEEISIGNFVLTGGELAAMVVTDSGMISNGAVWEYTA